MGNLWRRTSPGGPWATITRPWVRPSPGAAFQPCVRAWRRTSAGGPWEVFWESAAIHELLIPATSSASWANASGVWDNTTGSEVIQGGLQDYQGYWFYGSALANALANATAIESVQIKLWRLSTPHGVPGGSTIRLGAHSLTSKPGGDPGGIASPHDIATLIPGDSNYFPIPASWYSGIKSGSNRGFAIRYGTTSYSDSRYARLLGAGTTGGQVYLRWRE